jgi:hypothetical protein
MHGGRLPHNAAKPRHVPASSRWPEEPPDYHGNSDGVYSARGYLDDAEAEKLLPERLDGTEAATRVAAAGR